MLLQSLVSSSDLQLYANCPDFWMDSGNLMAIISSQADNGYWFPRICCHWYKGTENSSCLSSVPFSLHRVPFVLSLSSRNLIVEIQRQQLKSSLWATVRKDNPSSVARNEKKKISIFSLLPLPEALQHIAHSEIVLSFGWIWDRLRHSVCLWCKWGMVLGWRWTWLFGEDLRVWLFGGDLSSNNGRIGEL